MTRANTDHRIAYLAKGPTERGEGNSKNIYTTKISANQSEGTIPHSSDS